MWARSKMGRRKGVLLLVYAIGLLVGERLRDHLYGERIAENEAVSAQERIPGLPTHKRGKKWKRYSGLFVLLKQKWSLSSAEKPMILEAALATFMALVHYPVPTHV